MYPHLIRGVPTATKLRASRSHAIHHLAGSDLTKFDVIAASTANSMPSAHRDLRSGRWRRLTRILSFGIARLRPSAGR
jgi:hypothetical protein